MRRVLSVFAGAIEDFTIAVEQAPFFGDGWKRRGQARSALGHHKEALEVCSLQDGPSLVLADNMVLLCVQLYLPCKLAHEHYYISVCLSGIRRVALVHMSPALITVWGN